MRELLIRVGCDEDGARPVDDGGRAGDLEVGDVVVHAAHHALDIVGQALGDAANLGDYIGDSDTAPTGITAGGSSQANVSNLGWTWAGQAGKLNF